MQKARNRGFLKRYAVRGIYSNKMKSFFIGLTIFIITVFVLTISLYLAGTRTIVEDRIFNSHQATFLNFDIININKLKEHRYIEKAGMGNIMGEYSRQDYKIRVSYMDADLRDMASLSDIEGKEPAGKNEIVVPKDYLNHLGLPEEIGQKLKLNLGNGVEEEYTISGIIQKESAPRLYVVLVSRDYVEQYGDKTQYYIQLKIKDASSYGEEELKTLIQSIADENQVEKVNYFSSYFSYVRGFSPSQTLAAIGVGVLLAFAAYMILYNIFYIFVLQDTREIGLLRLIGADKKQIKKILYQRGIYLATRGIFIGVFCSILIAGFVLPNGFRLIFEKNLIATGKSLILTVLYVSLVVFLSLRIPMRRIKVISPQEAFKSSFGESHIIKRKEQYKVTPKFLALLNTGRDTKKRKGIIISLGIAGILFITAASHIRSIDTEILARQLYPNEEFKIFLSQENSGKEHDNVENYRILQQNNPIDNELIKKIEGMPNIKSVREYKGTLAEVVINQGSSSYSNIEGYYQEAEDAFKKYLLDGTVDGVELERENGVIIKSPGTFKEIYGWDVKLNDSIQVKTVNGELELKVMGIISAYESENAFLFVPESILQNIQPLDNYNYRLTVELQNKDLNSQKEAEKLLRNIIRAEELEMDTLQDSIGAYEIAVRSTKRVAYGITFLIIFMGIMNLINTLMTNVISRVVEISTMQIVGLDEKQLIQMIRNENLYYLGSISIVSAIGGGILSLIVYHILKNNPIFGRLPYVFPFIETIIYIVVIFTIEEMLLQYSIKYLEKKPLVERAKN
ncbi:FtsX-like permease family protein [Tissierella sp.]|uniref:ABC transporter permease n=1 Tax=Tissierella sp. TaxID=41274 RepID=UPI0030704D7F